MDEKIFKKRTGLSIKEAPRKIDVSKIGKYIGGGADGIVYCYGDDKVIKFHNCEFDHYKQENLLYRLRKLKKLQTEGKLNQFVKLYDFGKMPNFQLNFKTLSRSDVWLGGLYYTLKYKYGVFSIMEKLEKPKERHGLWCVIDKLQEGARRKNKCNYVDCHYGNIMLTKRGKHKFVDLDRLLFVR